jgi:hypothetical protein
MNSKLSKTKTIRKFDQIPTHIPMAKIIDISDNEYIVKEENEKDLNTRFKVLRLLFFPIHRVDRVVVHNK